MTEPARALPEIEPHRLLPVELIAGGMLFVALGLYFIVSDLVSLGFVQTKSLVIGPAAAGFGAAMAAIGYSLRTWYARHDEPSGDLTRPR